MADIDTKVQIETSNDGLKQFTISDIEIKFKAFRINNFKLFAVFNSIFHFYKCQERQISYRVETVYYKFDTYYAIERIINRKNTSLIPSNSHNVLYISVYRKLYNHGRCDLYDRRIQKDEHQ